MIQKDIGEIEERGKAGQRGDRENRDERSRDIDIGETGVIEEREERE